MSEYGDYEGPHFRFILLEGTKDDLTGLLQMLTEMQKVLNLRMDSILKLTFFLAAKPPRLQIVSELARLFEGRLPATEVLLQRPLGKNSALLLVWLASGPNVEVRYPANGISILLHRDITLKFVGSIYPEFPLGLYQEQFASCFHQLQEKLESIESSVFDIVKTWTYYGDIPRLSDTSDFFLDFNISRTQFFRETGLLSGRCSNAFLPANTGVGTQEDSPSISGIACKTRNSWNVFALDNPMQTNPSHYPKTRSAIPPLFSRAVVLSGPKNAIALISGTGSVIGSSTSSSDSASRQTSQTLELIDVLLGKQNLANNGILIESGGLGRLLYCVVYLKCESDYPSVRRQCEKSIPANIPVAYVQADLVRDDHLVEIEGAAVFQT